MDTKPIIDNLHKWRMKHISSKQLLLILSLITGLMGGLAGVVLKNLIHFLYATVTKIIYNYNLSFLYLILPFIGIMLAWLFVRYVVKDSISQGISRVLYAMSRNRGKIKMHNTYSSLVGSSITSAFGGSIGLEGPIVLTGAAIGSNLGRYFGFDYKSITLLIGCGAAGATAGIFKAPIAGVVFCLEVLMLDLTARRLIPLLISSATGYILAAFFMGKDVLFTIDLASNLFVLKHIPYYIILGILAGFISVYFSRTSTRIEKKLTRDNKWRQMVAGGLLTSLLIFLFPPLFGEGYSFLNLLINEGTAEQILKGSIFEALSSQYVVVIIFLVLVMLLKVVAMTTTNSGGGVGGIFAPTLFTGGVLGYILIEFLNKFTEPALPRTCFILAGMAGLMAGVMLAPLTAIFLIAEITGGYQLLVPLIITAVSSYLTTIIFEPHSYFHKTLISSGELITHDKDKAALNILSIDKLIEKDFTTTPPNITLGEFVKLVAQSTRSIFPVVDEENNFLGIIFINDVKHLLFDKDKYDIVTTDTLSFYPDTVVEYDESMESVAQKFSDTPHYNLPVIKDNKYLGFISRANFFSAYRELVKDFVSD